jgi:hypothetical protein
MPPGVAGGKSSLADEPGTARTAGHLLVVSGAAEDRGGECADSRRRLKE